MRSRWYLSGRTWGGALAIAAALSGAVAVTPHVYADNAASAGFQGSLTQVKSAQVDPSNKNVVNVVFNNDVQGKITFLEEDIFRYNVDPKGEFSEYAAPRNKDHKARIPQQPDSSDAYKKPQVSVKDEDGSFLISAGSTTIVLEKATGKMSVKSGGDVVMAEKEPLSLGGSTTQTVEARDGEMFFGGGTQNGRFTHRGSTVKIYNDGWVDGGVASPSPFYWSSKGYGVLRNTFSDGTYDFAKTDAKTVATTQSEAEFDAYYFVADAKGNEAVAQDLLGDYFEVTGNPVLLPEYGFYLGHLNAYNRDGWSSEKQDGGKAWTTKNGAPAGEAGSTKYEYGMSAGYVVPGNLTAETLNGTGPTDGGQNMQTQNFSEEFSARQVIEDYEAADMPLGWFLPNDGYGAGYGQNGFNKTGGVDEQGKSSADRIAAVDANVENLKQFTQFANSHGIATGLWTQSYLTPDSNNDTKWHLLRDFEKEVKTGGISTLKTDVAWVGPGFSMALDGTKTAYDTATTAGDVRPNIVTLCGWAGTQRFGGIWTGDQTGGNWEYIRFHIPTYIGQSLSGNPNIGSDMDGIFGGAPIIATRDYQWKAFTPTMLDMDGWGTYRKAPMTHGDPYTGISRMYLKLKSQLMPYIYTSAASAANIDTGNKDTGLPMIRAMLLGDNSAYAASRDTQYQYTFGDAFLVAPVYKDTRATESGDDVRDKIYLPNYGDEDNPTIWIDYFSGKQYRGGQVLNNFEAPLWKLPLFVKAGSIVPMYQPNNNPQDISDANPKGLDKTQRIVEFWPAGKTEYTLFEDDGESVKNDLTEVEGYGKVAKVSYGEHVSTTITSEVKDGDAILAIGASKGSYEGYDSNRTSTVVVNVSKVPSGITYNGAEVQKVDDKAALDKVADKAVWCYVESPDLNTTTEDEGFGKVEIKTTPKVYVKLPKTDVAANEQKIVVKGFENDGHLDKDQENAGLAAPSLQVPEDGKTPTSLKLTWNKVADATSYDIEVDGQVFSMGDAESYVLTDLEYHSQHVFKIRSRNAEGYSKWSEEVSGQTLEDPWRNAPTPQATTWTGDYYAGMTEARALDHNLDADHFHSSEGALGKTLTLDYGSAFKLDKFEYYPREDAANGTVTKMRIETSLDGQHWTSEEASWRQDNSVKTVSLAGHAARYVRLTPLESVGGFFSARELVVYKVDGSTPWAVGSNTMSESVSEGDYTNMMNYLALDVKDSDFAKQIKERYADLNGNDAYDVYDYSFTMAALDGGTKKEGAVSGDLLVAPGKTHVAAGEEVSVDLIASDMANANALGALVGFDSSKFELVDNSISKSADLLEMENLSKSNKSKDTVNLAFANRGDKALFNGSGAVASFKLRAKAEADVKLTATSIAVGPAGDFVQIENTGEIAFPEKPTQSSGELGQDSFNITMTNDALPSDSGDNVKELVQQGSYAALFNGQNDRGFELKYYYAGKPFDERVGLPVNLGFTLKEPRALNEIVLTNGAAAANGSITSLKATVTFEDDTVQEFRDGAFSSPAEVYTFAISEANAGKKVKSVVITPLTSTGKATELERPDNRMLTIGEIDFKYTDAAPKVDEVKLDESNAKVLYENELTKVGATILPDIGYPFFTVESDKPDVAGVVPVQSGDSVTWYLHGNAPGTARITVKSVLDETKTASYTVEVKKGADASALVDAVEAAKKVKADLCEEQSYKALDNAVKAGESILKKEGATKQEVADAAKAINDALAALVFRPVDESKKIDLKADAVSASSSASESPVAGVVDGDPKTLWHSNYADGVALPQFLVFDLGKETWVSDITFLPRQDGGLNGDIFEAKVYARKASSAPEAPALDSDAAAGDDEYTEVGTFTFKNNGSVLDKRDEYKQMTFEPVKTSAIKLVVTKSGAQDPSKVNKFASAAEVNLYAADEPAGKPDPEPPVDPNPEPPVDPDPNPEPPVDPDPDNPVDPKPENPDPDKPGQGGGQGSGQGGSGQSGSGQQGGQSSGKPNGKPAGDTLAQTGDPALTIAVPVAAGGGLLAAIGAFLRRKRR